MRITINPNNKSAASSSREEHLNKHKNRSSMWLVLLVLGITTVFLVWNNWVRQQDYMQQEYNTVKNSVNGTAREINILLNEFQRSVKLLGQRENLLLRKIANNPNDIDSYDLLVEKVKNVFPESFAVTLADAKGNPFVEDFDGFIVEICKKDISNFAHEKHPPEIYIHPNPFLYHFDVMARVDLGFEEESIFFVSFRPDIIAKLLASSQLYQHKLILLKQDRPGLVEVVAEGSRQSLKEHQFFLTEKEIADITYSIPVDGTFWNLASLPRENIVKNHLYEIWGEVIIQFLFLCTLSFFIIRHLEKSGKKILEQNMALANHAQEIHKNEKRLERAQQIANMGHWDYDLITDNLSLSEGARQIFDVNPVTTLNSQQIFHKIYPVDRARIKRMIASSIVKRKPYRTEFRLQKNDGAINMVSASVELTIDSNNNPLQLFGIVQDITLQKQAEDASKKALVEKIDAVSASEAKSEFLANMSHEIRTPLTAIIGFAEALLHSDQPMEERTNAIRTIIRNGDHLLNIINDILDLSKIEAEKLEFEKTSFSPFQVLSDVESLIRMQTRNKGIDFAILYNFPLPAFINSDPLRVKQILINLCSNAIKFTSNGFIHVTVGYDKTRDTMWFEVIDSGIGMNEQEISRIFETFTQADLSTTKEYGGTGLGLTISKYLSEMMGGSIEVDSHPGKGSQFRAMIKANVREGVPFISNEKQIPKDSAVISTIQQANTLVGRVLLAEDNEDNQRLLTLYIEKMGAKLEIAKNGESAIEKALGDDFDLILMDMQMPVLDGIEAVKQLRAKQYKKPIVALTANAMIKDRERCLAAGCDDFIAKPIHRNDLYEVVSKYLDKAIPEKKNTTPIYSTLLDEEPDLVDIVSRFVDNLPKTTQTLFTSANKSDWDEVKSIAHQLKGVGGGYGYPQLTDIAAKIQFQLENKCYEEVMALIGQLENISSQIYKAIYPKDIDKASSK